MGNTENIKLDEQEFKVFRKMPIPVSREIQKLFIEMADGFHGTLEELEQGITDLQDLKGINMDLLYEVHNILLIKMVISPNITLDDINNIGHELQPYFQDLIDLLFERYTQEKENIKKKSIN